MMYKYFFQLYVVFFILWEIFALRGGIKFFFWTRAPPMRATLLIIRKNKIGHWALCVWYQLFETSVWETVLHMIISTLIVFYLWGRDNKPPTIVRRCVLENFLSLIWPCRFERHKTTFSFAGSQWQINSDNNSDTMTRDVHKGVTNTHG